MTLSRIVRDNAKAFTEEVKAKRGETVRIRLEECAHRDDLAAQAELSPAN